MRIRRDPVHVPHVPPAGLARCPTQPRPNRSPRCTGGRGSVGAPPGGGAGRSPDAQLQDGPAAARARCGRGIAGTRRRPASARHSSPGAWKPRPGPAAQRRGRSRPAHAELPPPARPGSARHPGLRSRSALGSPPSSAPSGQLTRRMRTPCGSGSGARSSRLLGALAAALSLLLPCPGGLLCRGLPLLGSLVEAILNLDHCP